MNVLPCLATSAIATPFLLHGLFSDVVQGSDFWVVRVRVLVHILYCLSSVSDFFYVVVCVLIKVYEKTKIRDTTFGPWRWRKTVAWRRLEGRREGNAWCSEPCFLVCIFTFFRVLWWWSENPGFNVFFSSAVCSSAYSELWYEYACLLLLYALLMKMLISDVLTMKCLLSYDDSNLRVCVGLEADFGKGFMFRILTVCAV